MEIQMVNPSTSVGISAAANKRLSMGLAKELAILSIRGKTFICLEARVARVAMEAKSTKNILKTTTGKMGAQVQMAQAL